VTLEVEVLPDPEAVAERGADLVATLMADAVSASGRCTFAVSGGRTPWAMFERLRLLDVPWDRLAVYQVDERVAPEGDPDRNLTHLIASLPEDGAADVHPMPVNDEDLDRAAAGYAASLPDRFDLVHLGLGPDGHTASLVPDDPVLEVRGRGVALTRPYQGHRRMTLTYPVLDRASVVVWLVTGADKSDALRRLRARDRSIPAGRVDAADQRVLCDSAAAGGS
jgi:6-phosphogluconolactonase